MIVVVAGVTFGPGAQIPSGAAVEAGLNRFGASPAAFFPGVCRGRNDFDQERTITAIYADTTFEVSKALSLRLHLRYSEDDTG